MTVQPPLLSGHPASPLVWQPAMPPLTNTRAQRSRHTARPAVVIYQAMLLSWARLLLLVHV